MKIFAHEFKAPIYYSLRATALSHGWVNLLPFNYNDTSNELSLNIVTREAINHIIIRQNGGYVLVRATEPLDDIIIEQISRSICINEDTTELYKVALKLSPDITTLIKNGYGRLLKSTSLWEDMVKTLLTTNCNWKKTQTMVCNLCNSNKFACFPSPDSINKLSHDDLRMMGLGYRASYIQELAYRFVKNEFSALEDQSLDYLAKKNILNSIKGFGKYAVNHSLILLNDFSAIPYDSDVKSFFTKTNTNDSSYNNWGIYKFWGYKLDRISKKQNWIGQ